MREYSYNSISKAMTERVRAMSLYGGGVFDVAHMLMMLHMQMRIECTHCGKLCCRTHKKHGRIIDWITI